MDLIDGQKLTPSCFNEYLTFIHNVTGITIGKTRQSMVVGRIRKRVRTLGIENYKIYLQLIKSDEQEQMYFIDLITTNETYFYRTPRVWEFIAKEFMKNYYARMSDKELKIWSAASSTGEEAYSLGILCHEFKNKNPGLNFNITGTDISPAVIEKAAKGHYTGRAIENFRKINPDLFNKYMRGDNKNGYQVAPEVKSYIDFKTHNLFSKFKSNRKFDLILLRNVLIYFNREDQEKVLANIYQNLAPDGYLIIGESESLIHIDTDFVSIMPLVYQPRSSRKIKVPVHE